MLKCGQTGRKKYCFGGFDDNTNTIIAEFIVCPNCQKKCSEKENFCTKCGAKLKNENN